MSIKNYRGEIHSAQHRRAIQYARAGMRVGPCGRPRYETYEKNGTKGEKRIYTSDGGERYPLIDGPDGKEPLTKNGHKGFTTDLQEIERLWARWPDANIGWNPPEDVVVIDIDYSDDPAEDGFRKWEEIVSGRDLPLTTSVRTGGGGRHIWFRVPEGMGRALRAEVPGGGIDFKSSTGFVVLPGSTHENGNKYVFEHEVPGGGLPVLPDFLLDHLYYPKSTPGSLPAGSQPAVMGDPRTTQYVDKALKNACQEVSNAGEGTRNSTLNKQAYSIGGLVAGGYLDEDFAREMLRNHALSTGLTEGEVDKTLDSAFRDAEPRVVQLDSNFQGETVFSTRDRAGSSSPASQNSYAIGGEEVLNVGDLDREHHNRSLSQVELEAQTSEQKDWWEREVQRKAQEIEIVNEAKRRVASTAIDGLLERLQPPVALEDFLNQPREETQWIIEGLQPVGTRMLLAAQAKAGKTTLVVNLIKSLADGDEFLKRYPVTFSGRITLIDNEMNEEMLSRWFQRLAIKNHDVVEIITLRGREADFDILNDRVRAKWAEILAGTDYLILDCLRPAMDALGLDENREAGTFLSAFGQLLYEAGISNSLLVHHMGHNGDRARGDSRITDWPDATWKLTRQDGAARHRALSAVGRDVDVPGVILQHNDGVLRVPPEMDEQPHSLADLASQGFSAEDWVIQVLAEEKQPRSKSWVTRGKWKTEKAEDKPVPLKKDVEPAIDSLLKAGHLVEVTVAGGTRLRLNKEERLSTPK